MIELLHLLNDRHGALFQRHLVALAAELRLGLAEVAEVASFYHHFETVPDGTSRLFGDASAPAVEVAPGVSNRAAIRVLRPAFFKKCLLNGDIGFAESFMDGDWETPDLTAVIGWFVLNHRHAPTLSGSSRAQLFALNVLRAFDRLGHLLRPNNRATARRNNDRRGHGEQSRVSPREFKQSRLDLLPDFSASMKSV